MASVREWQFKRKFRTNAYGWRASSLAIGRLKEAAAEIRSVAKSDPVAAGDGVVSLMERIWPAFQGIDTSSGALGAAAAQRDKVARSRRDARCARSPPPLEEEAANALGCYGSPIAARRWARSRPES